MAVWLGATFILVTSLLLIKVLRLVDRAYDVLDVTSKSLGVMGNSRLSDREKASALRHLTLPLLGLLLVLVCGGGIAVLAPIGVLWLADARDLISATDVLSTTISPWFIASSCVMLIALLALLPRNSAPETSAVYSPLDILLHRLSFCTRWIQIKVSVIEDRACSKSLRGIENSRPIFITALPRAGTTLLLECCSRVPELASHTYRDMPFLFTPCFWGSFATRFAKQGEARERSHGDGMMIDYDSPEAFEEMIWKEFWPRQYRKDRIRPAKQQRNPDFERFLQNHMRKIIQRRRGALAKSARYVSKNNCNVSRLKMLKTIFSDSIILIPFRDPFQHCASLLRQHKNFLKQHATEPFVAEYMREIGHFDFGENLLPIDFDGWMSKVDHLDPLTDAFWLEYWIAAYSHVANDHSESVTLLDFDGFCNDPNEGLRKLGEVLQLKNVAAIQAGAPSIRPQRSGDFDVSHLPSELVCRVKAVHEQLEALSNDTMLV